MRDIRSNGGTSKNKRQRFWASRTWRKVVVSRLQITRDRDIPMKIRKKSKSVHRVSECSQSHDFGRENERRNHFTCHDMTWLLMMMTTSDFPVWNHWFLILYFLYFLKILLVSQPFLSSPANWCHFLSETKQGRVKSLLHLVLLETWVEKENSNILAHRHHDDDHHRFTRERRGGQALRYIT